MASPFSIFRKHQRAMIAVLGILCMFAFTFTGFVGGFGSGSDGGNQQNPVAVTTSFGDFRESDLRDMRYQRNDIKKFLGQAIMLTVDPQMRPFLEQRLGAMLDSQIGPSSENAVLETRVLAREAKEAGMVVSDASVTDFLREQTGDQVRGEELQQILDSLSRGGRQVSTAMLYESLRTELLATKMRQMYFFASLQATPAERWDFYQRLNRRVRVELAPVAAADFVAKIANPSDSVAQKFFDQYKEKEPQPGSPEPGFKIPHRSAFQYFEAHYQDFYHPEEVAEADINAHYEKFKDTQYLYNEPFGLAEEDDEPAAENPAAEKKPTDDKPANKPPAAVKPDDKKTDDIKPADKKVEEKKPDNQPAVDKKADDKKAAGAKHSGSNQVEPADDKPADSKKADSKKDESEESDSKCGGDKQIDEEEQALAAADDDKPDATPAAAEKATADADAKSAASTPDKQPAGTPPAASTPATTSPAGNTPADTATTPPVDIKARAAGTGTQLATKKKSAAPPLSDRFILPNDITKGQNPKYEPLWQAEPKIRKALAGAKAVEAMDKVLLGLKSKLRPHSDALLKWESRKQQDPNAPKPTPPDYQAWAKDSRGITANRIPLSPDYQISQMPGIGESQVSGQPFVAFAATGLKLFHAVESQDNDGNRYLFWKTDDQETRVPQFSDVRDEVVQVWKLHDARQPMVKKAEELAKLARNARKSLKDSLASQAGIKVTETPAFSWMTSGSAGQFGQRSPPRISEVPDTIDIGAEFMQSVFDLQVGDVGVAENHPQSVAYVVRVTTSEPPQPVLRDMFLADRFETYAPVVMEANGELYRKWIDDQMAAAKVHWVRRPYDEMQAE